MKKVLAVVLFVVFAASLASAELLTTANSVGKGKWAFLGSGLQDQNFGNSSVTSLTTIGGYIGYGINEKLDAYFQAGQSTISGVSSTGTGMGLNLKYTMLEEGRDVPVTVAAGAGYKSMNWSTGTNGSQLSLAAGISRVWSYVIPYSGLAYRKNSVSGNDISSQIDLTVGSAVPWQNMGAFFVEYTLQTITPNGASNYSSSQIGAGFGTRL